jgi:hypothetical protein
MNLFNFHFLANERGAISPITCICQKTIKAKTMEEAITSLYDSFDYISFNSNFAEISIMDEDWNVLSFHKGWDDIKALIL